MIINELRQKHPRFVFESFSFAYSNNTLRCKYQFTLEPDIHFEPELIIELPGNITIDAARQQYLQNFLFHLGLVEIMSYWKAACSPTIVVKAGFLDARQIEWLNDLIINGMGEFFYVNNIDPYQPGFLTLTCDTEAQPLSRFEGDLDQDHSLVLTSGGKDTALTVELLSKAKYNFGCLLLNPTVAALQIAEAAEARFSIIARRSIDSRLLELNKLGYLNGHTPFSAYLAFLGVTCAVLSSSGHVIVSNERSSDEGNVEFLGRKVNHQYSKTFAFEEKFREYVYRYVASHVRYFSFLRPLYEIQIAGLLAGYPRYFGLFKSCNRNQRENNWCGRCPKCLSVFIMLYPFIQASDVLRIFGRDLFEDESVTPVLNELTGLAGHKPFECVGTLEETVSALFLGIKKAKLREGDTPVVWRYVEQEVLPKYPQAKDMAPSVMSSWGDSHALPEKFEELLKHHIKSGGALS